MHLDPQQALYTHGQPLCPEDRTNQIRHLAKVGLAATSSNLGLRHMDVSLQALFEVIYRLADELEDCLDAPKVRA